MKVEEAERAIGAILAKLEETNGGYVEAIAVKDIEVTCLTSHGREFQRRVQIDFKHKPGTHWDK